MKPVPDGCNNECSYAGGTTNIHAHKAYKITMKAVIKNLLHVKRIIRWTPDSSAQPDIVSLVTCILYNRLDFPADIGRKPALPARGTRQRLYNTHAG